MSLKICSKCKIEKDTTEFSQYLKRGKPYIHSYCKPCKNSQCGERYKRDAHAAKVYYQKYQQKIRDDRARSILIDSRKSDRKKGLDNDLDLPFIERAIEQPCSYCRDETCIKTLDRIDNDIGHTQSNVVVSCLRCNIVRGSMPYGAWLYLADGMRRAREDGLLGDWNTASVAKRRNAAPLKRDTD